MLESVWNEPRTASRDATESSRAVCSRSRSEKHLEHLNTELHITYTHVCVYSVCVSGSQGHTGGEDVLFLRLYLLQSLLAYHDGKKNQALNKLRNVNAHIFNYSVSSTVYYFDRASSASTAD